MNTLNENKFEVCKGFEGAGIILPQRTTTKAAGYDFRASEDVVIPPLFQQNDNGSLSYFGELKGTLIPTGVKCKINDGEYLQLAARSSGFNSHNIIMVNGIGIIDGDYYENPKNDGHIMFQYINLGVKEVIIKAGERIGQGVFLPYNTTEDDHKHEKQVRVGGHGSTGGE